MSRPASGNMRVNFYIDPKVLAILKRLARARGTTYSDLIRMATNAYVISESRAISKIPPVSRRAPPEVVPAPTPRAPQASADMLNPRLGHAK